MKKVLFAVTFFCSLFLFGQTRADLSVAPDDKITMHGFGYWQELLVKSKDTSFSYKLHTTNPDVIKGLKPGSYQLTAVSLFNHRVCKKVKLDKKTPLVKLKGLQSFYKRAPETKNLTEKIKLNDTLYLLFSSSNNENVREKIAVTKTKAGYKAIQYKGITNEVFQEMQFRDEAYKAVVKFETEGKKANSPKAETAPKAEVYTIALNKEILSFIVPGEWHGLDNVKAVLFLVENK